MESGEVWDSVVDGTTKAAKTVAAVAEDLYERGRTSIILSRLKSELRAAYQTLGVIEYKKTVSKKDDPVAREEAVTTITRLRAKIAALNENASELCKSCGKALADGAEYCSACGKKV